MYSLQSTFILGDQPKGRQSALLLLSKLSTFLLITQYEVRHAIALRPNKA